MDDVRLGRAMRALRRRRGWRQRDLASAAGVSQTTVSMIERGHLDAVAMRTLRAVAAALDTRLLAEIRWRAGDLDRLVDRDHAALGSAFAGLLHASGWLVMAEVTYSEFGERGSIDLLAFQPASGCLLVVEIKTEVASGEQTLRRLDEKTRLAAKIARRRFGWQATSVSRLLVVADTATNRRRIQASAAFFEAALPSRNVAIKRWLWKPIGAISGRLFLSPSAGGAAIQALGGRARVRMPRTAPPGARSSVATIGRTARTPAWRDPDDRLRG